MVGRIGEDVASVVGVGRVVGRIGEDVASVVGVGWGSICPGTGWG